jgi:hypothetical protein
MEHFVRVRLESVQLFSRRSDIVQHNGLRDAEINFTHTSERVYTYLVCTAGDDEIFA